MSGRPRSADRFVSTTFSMPQSTHARLQRILDRQRRPDSPTIFGRDLLLAAIAAEEARLHLPPLDAAPLPQALVVPGSRADYARQAVAPVPPAPPPPVAPTVPGEGPWLPPPELLQDYFSPPPGRTPDDVFAALLPKAHQ